MGALIWIAVGIVIGWVLPQPVLGELLLDKITGIWTGAKAKAESTLTPKTETETKTEEENKE